MTKFKIIVFLWAILFVALPNVATAKSQKPQTFEAWLEKYGAWDQLEKEYSQEITSDSPEVILKRAEVYLNLNSPKQALEILEMTPAFTDKSLEAKRLWLGGQAHRGNGDLSKAVLWFSQAAENIPDAKQLENLFEDEQSLETIWADVWLKMYWGYSANYTLSKNAQFDALKRISSIGGKIWKTPHWDKVQRSLYANTQNIGNNTQSAPQETLATTPPLVTDSDAKLVAQALAAVSLEKFDEAKTYASQINAAPVQFFWTSVIEFIQSGSAPDTLSILIDGNYLKAKAFWQGNILSSYASDRSAWLLGNPDSGPWTKFRNNLLSMPAIEANNAINNELGSMLISEQTANLLTNFKLALNMSNGDFTNAKTTWDSIEKQQLPLTLKLAGLVLFKGNLNKIIPPSPKEAFMIYPIIAALSGATGYDLNSDSEAPFWISAPQEKLKTLSEDTYPMDKLLLLAHWQQIFDSKPNSDMAKRAAYLFDSTTFGDEALLYLADEAVKAKKLQLGAFYLNKVNHETQSPTNQMAWLDIKTRLELDSGRTAAALKTYEDMEETGIDIPVMTRLRMALLYQQRRDFKAARKQLLTMWENRSQMTTTLQAETLFWLGEGEQGMRNPEAALDYYLKLAWQYPQENIWALTAMYRASLIYEKRGKYDTAKRLLTTVVKQADRKEQKEAAKARISAIDKKMGKTSKKSQHRGLVYPF